MERGRHQHRFPLGSVFIYRFLCLSWSLSLSRCRKFKRITRAITCNQEQSQDTSHSRMLLVSKRVSEG